MLKHTTAQGEVIARDVSFEDYMRLYAEHHVEWVEGTVIKLSPVSEEHDELDGFLYRLLSDYLDETGEAIMRRHPFVMKITPQSPAREPDLHIVLKDRAHILQRTMTAGPADIVIEIVSPESVERDTEEKLAEYEAGGVREYWLLNPLDQTARFYGLGTDDKYRLIEPANGAFQSTILSKFRLDVRLLWQTPPPTGRQIAALVEAMLK
jgi:Uma2 family endonuclease